MRYYVVADPHGFFTELKTALEEKGFFSDTEPHKLIICGDLFDRGAEALAMQENENWRASSPEQFAMARWTNGIEAAHYGMTEPGKTIVCGHWHCSFGHANYEGACCEFGEDADFSPYYSDGIIALDACTAVSKKVNCIVIED